MTYHTPASIPFILNSKLTTTKYTIHPYNCCCTFMHCLHLSQNYTTHFLYSKYAKYVSLSEDELVRNDAAASPVSAFLMVTAVHLVSTKHIILQVPED